ncbi:unnamed protein product [Didymodactylos carnosus]|uniref:Alanyl-transfer RNA synthetases family profile domain-containing protein n=1 Tax=Didymodactylos carnosus TaxID=1234261 RepID=A0A815GNX9_9BILA|nr:unnamed protein product [Didymodactylos carnosus]CAF1602926.1 unnamed protein product [Didymodactylos carnosus]CAF4202058.1 unnamed protein product [Didymodactylos carnosus]CAF4412483.1 unnamed protein product [Didymodactylos carnosus]
MATSTDSTQNQTELDYMKDSYLFDSQAVVRQCETVDGGKFQITLDRTIFHPQGGGQPYDVGTISNDDAVFNVNEVRMNPQGIVIHTGEYEHGTLAPGQTVNLHVDEARRRLNCRLHSAGHLLDVAVRNAELSLVPGKGYHFIDAPYVEYDGKIEPALRESSLNRIQIELKKLLTIPFPVKVIFENTDNGDPITYSVKRQVSIADGYTCPCGGTHVHNIRDIGNVEVTKLRVQGPKTRISYKLETN